MPIGPWPRDKRLSEAGVYGLLALLDGLYGLSIKIFTDCLGWTPEELEDFLTEVEKELKRKSIHSYWPTVSAENLRSAKLRADVFIQYVVLGQKPG